MTQMTQPEKLPYGPTWTEETVAQRFERIVAQYPNNLAVDWNQQALTYSELNRWANQIAGQILQAQSDKSRPACLFFQHEHEAYAAVIAAIKVGKVYSALNPLFPEERLTACLDVLEPDLILTDRKNAAIARSLLEPNQRLLVIEETADRSPTANPEIAIQPDAPCAICFTSGSTGRPKGVVRSHRAFLHFTWLITGLASIRASDRIGLFYDIGFGASEVDIFGALLNGAALLPYDLPREGVNPLAAWLRDTETSIFHLPVSAFRQFTDTLSPGEKFPSIHCVAPASGRLFWSDVEAYRSHFSRACTFLARFASNEATLVAAHLIDHDTPFLGEVVPAGRILPGKELLLLDDSGQPVFDGQVGEMVIRSRYLASGYWRQPELTSQRFQSDAEQTGVLRFVSGDMARIRPDGLLEFVGRVDHMVKIRGYRVELDTIDIALRGFEKVQDSVTIAQEIEGGELRLVNYYIPVVGTDPTVRELRHVLSQRLPNYMVPSLFIGLESLPLTPNGKVNRQALPTPDNGRPDIGIPLVEPRTPIEDILCVIWREALKLDEIGIHDPFLDLGGNSLQAMRIAARVQSEFGVEIPLAEMFAASTVAEMALTITSCLVASAALSEEFLVGEELDVQSFVTDSLISHTAR